jgi:hypothetical protein
MANQIQLSSDVTVTVGTDTTRIYSANAVISTATGAATKTDTVIATGGTAQAITLGGVSSGGNIWLTVLNPDTTNQLFVGYSPGGTFAAFAIIPPAPSSSIPTPFGPVLCNAAPYIKGAVTGQAFTALVAAV